MVCAISNTKKCLRDFEGRTWRKNKCFYFRLKLQKRYLRESPEAHCLRLLNKLCEIETLNERKNEVKNLLKTFRQTFS